MLTHLLNFFIVTERISDWHHFCNSAGSSFYFLLQLCRFSGLYYNYAGGTFCYSYVGGSFWYNYAGDCFCCNYAVRNSCSTLMQVTVCAANIWVKIFIVIMQVGVCCNYTSGIFCNALYTWLFLLKLCRWLFLL